MIALRLILITLSLYACAKQSEPETPLSNQWDLNSITTTEYNTEPQNVDVEIVLEKDIVIGGNEKGDEWQLFGYPPYPMIGPDNRIYLIDNMRCEIYIVSPEGNLENRLGGKGSGPGEFRGINRMYWAERGKEFWVDDIELRRMSRYTANGELIDTFSLPNERGYRWRKLRVVTRDRSIVERSSTHPNNTSTLLQFGLLNHKLLIDKIIIEYQLETHYLTDSGPRIQLPFRNNPFIVLYNERQFIIAEPHTANLLMCDILGQPYLRIKVPWISPHITHNEIKQWKDRLSVQISRGVLDEIPLPKTKPVFTNVIVDDKGQIWVYTSLRNPKTDHEDSSSRQVDILSGDGKLLYTQYMPIFPFIVQGDYAYHIPLGFDEIPRMERYYIRKRELSK